MDKEQARFILRSYRPDGADAADADFANALQLATEDREIGEWFAKERASDAEFSKALADIELPDSLRNEILDALAWQRGDLPHIESPDDETWARALAGISPPPALRTTIVAAMNACASTSRKPVPIWRKYAVSAAAAAILALAIGLPSMIRNPESPGQSATIKHAANLAPLPVELVRAGFINTYQNPGFTLDTGRASHREIMRQLEERGLPCPTCIPPGLRKIEGLGCREIIIDGRRGAIVCYERGEGGLVHLVIFRVEDIEDPLPFRRNAMFAQHGDWAAAAWRNAENAFLLLGHTDVSQIAALF
ncbi:MAG: hypothetical protein ACNA8L_05150 [Luteolibacter sp.]